MGIAVGPAVPTLTRWGVGSDADLVYRTLRSLGPRTAGDLATELGLPRQRIGDAVAELRACGAATPVNGSGRSRKSPVWVTRSPDHVVAALRSRQLRLIDQHVQARRHHEVVRLLDERLRGVGLPATPTLGGVLQDGVRYLATRGLLRRRLAELVHQERHDHLVINTEEVFEAESARAAGPLMTVFAERGVHVRVIGRPPVDGDAVDPSGHLVNGTTFEYRETVRTPLKLFVCDRRVALFPLDPLDFERGYFEVTRPSTVGALIRLFETQWASADDPQRGGVPSIHLSARERDLIALLAAGHTDVSAAQHLRISARSVTNRMRALMDRLGVENRFQLGLVLGATRAAVPPALDPASDLRRVS